jgi:hypothetical protein
MTDRIHQIANRSEATQRQQLYRRLDSQLSKGDKLSPPEVSSLLDQISNESAQHVRATLWRMLMRQDCDPQLTGFFTKWLQDSLKPERNMALRFLRECHPDTCPELYRGFANDPDPLVRYEALLCLHNAEPRKSLALLIDLFDALPLHLQEEAEMYILEGGSLEELERVRLNAKLRGSGTAYEVLSRALESRLTRS